MKVAAIQKAETTTNGSSPLRERWTEIENSDTSKPAQDVREFVKTINAKPAKKIGKR